MLRSLYERVREAYARAGERPGLRRRVEPLVSVCEREVATWSTWFPMSPRRRLWLYRNGFLSRCGVVYGLDRTNVSSYLSDYERELTARINGPWAPALDDKLFFHCLMGSLPAFADHRPRVYGVVANGQLHPFEADTAGHSPGETEPGDCGEPVASPGEWLDGTLSEGESVILKPVQGGGGDGVVRCQYRDGRLQNGEEDSGDGNASAGVDPLQGRGHYLLCEDIEQAAYSDRIFPGSANTVRVVTMRRESGEVVIPMAAHRFGTERSAPVDNWLAGGLSAEVDTETGELSTAAAYPFSGSVEWYENHPDTGEAVAGARVPGWEAVTAALRRLARRLSYTPYVGWDIVVTGEGEFTVLEANNCPGVTMLQVHRPLLEDDRARAFYATHGVLRGRS